MGAAHRGVPQAGQLQQLGYDDAGSVLHQAQLKRVGMASAGQVSIEGVPPQRCTSVMTRQGVLPEYYVNGLPTLDMDLLCQVSWLAWARLALETSCNRS